MSSSLRACVQRLPVNEARRPCCPYPSHPFKCTTPTSSKVLVLAAGPTCQSQLKTGEEPKKLPDMEPPVIAQPTTHHRIDDRGQHLRRIVNTSGQSPTSHRRTHRFERLPAHRRVEPYKQRPLPRSRRSRTKCVSKKVKGPAENCPRTVGSRACRDCLEAPPRSPLCSGHRDRVIPDGIAPADSSPRPTVWGSRMALPCSPDPPAGRLSQRPRPDDVAPSLHDHYSRFNTITGPSAPAPRFGTLGLVVVSTWPAPFASRQTGSHVPYPSLEPRHAASTPDAVRPVIRYLPDPSRAIDRATVSTPPRTFRCFISGSLSFVSVPHT